MIGSLVTWRDETRPGRPTLGGCVAAFSYADNVGWVALVLGEDGKFVSVKASTLTVRKPLPPTLPPLQPQEQHVEDNHR